MIKSFYKTIQEYVAFRPKVKKIIGIIFVVLGVSALVTPFTPGSWLIFIGLEFLGIRFLFWNKIKALRGK